MFESKRLPLSTLIDLCRTLRHYLGAGIQLLDVFKQLARKGRSGLRPIAERISLDLQQGDSLEKALEKEEESFPPMFLSMVSVGEDTGMLAEVFAELEKFFSRQLKLQRDFRSQITWPVIQLVLAILVIAGLILVLGMLPLPEGNGPRYDPLGLGLFGFSGAMIFLGAVGGIAVALAVGWIVMTRLLAERGWVDAFLLGVPVLGPCMCALALARFCLALRLTTETGMSIVEAVSLSLRATGNKAFIAGIPRAQTALRSGDELTAALAGCNVFPEEFLMVITVAEESGRLHDVLRHQGDHYDDESSRRLAALTALAGYIVWILIGIIMIAAIFRLAGAYLSKIGGG
jgi:type IV pilus assembly protein PilC